MTENAQSAAPLERLVSQSVRVDWWLAELSLHGYPCELTDGPHSNVAGVEQALYLIRGMGLERDRKFCAVRVEQFDVEARPHDTNEEALADCRMLISGDWRIGLTVKPKFRSDPLRYERGQVVAVFRDGHGGIADKNGVLQIKLDSGCVILRASEEWVTG